MLVTCNCKIANTRSCKTYSIGEPDGSIIYHRNALPVTHLLHIVHAELTTEPALVGFACVGNHLGYKHRNGAPDRRRIIDQQIILKSHTTPWFR